MNGAAAGPVLHFALPHIGISGDFADRAADLRFAAIHIDCAAIDVLNLCACFHGKAAALEPDSARGSLRRFLVVNIASAGRNDCRIVFNHAAGLHHQLGAIRHAHSGFAAEVAQHRAITERDRAGDGSVGGDDRVLYIIGIPAGVRSARAVIADSLCKYCALVLAGIAKNDVRQDQTGGPIAAGLHLDHGGVVPAAGEVVLRGKAIAARNSIRSVLITGDCQRLAIKTGARRHGQIAHNINRRAGWSNIYRFRQCCIRIFWRTVAGCIVSAVVYIDTGCCRCSYRCAGSRARLLLWTWLLFLEALGERSDLFSKSCRGQERHGHAEDQQQG